MKSSFEDQQKWQLDANKLLTSLLKKHQTEGLSPHIVWEVRPGVLIGTIDPMLPAAEADRTFRASAQILGLKVLSPVPVRPGLNVLRAEEVIDQNEVALIANLLYNPMS